MLMECTACTTRTTLSLSSSDFNLFQSHAVLLRLCQQCARETLWQMACHAAPASHGSAARNQIVAPGALPVQNGPQDGNRRKQRRTSMRTVACVRHEASEDVVKVIDLSRTGIRFQSSRQYSLGTWLQVAAPYSDGASAIFLCARVVWRKLVKAGLFEYGVQYAS